MKNVLFVLLSAIVGASFAFLVIGEGNFEAEIKPKNVVVASTTPLRRNGVAPPAGFVQEPYHCQERLLQLGAIGPLPKTAAFPVLSRSRHAFKAEKTWKDELLGLRGYDAHVYAAACACPCLPFCGVLILFLVIFPHHIPALGLGTSAVR